MVLWIKFTILIHFSSLIPNMSMFTLAISSLTTSNLPWFIDLTFQVLMQYCFLHRQTLLSPPDTSTGECCSCFDLAASFFLELFVTALHSSPVAYWTPSYLGGAHLLVSYLFAFSYCPLGSPGKNIGVSCQPLLLWTTFCQNSSVWPVCLGWPCMAWLIDSVSYASPCPTTRLWSMKEFIVCHLANSYHRMPCPM